MRRGLIHGEIEVLRKKRAYLREGLYAHGGGGELKGGEIRYMSTENQPMRMLIRSSRKKNHDYNSMLRLATK